MESESVRDLNNNNEQEIIKLVSENIDEFVNVNFKYIVENLKTFIAEDVETTYDNIKMFIVNDMVTMMSAISEVSSLDQSFEHVSVILQENVASVFPGVGYGCQKAQRLITSSYT
jgi:hypothetical protein